MIEYRESKISAHHNYLINGMLIPAFMMGDSNSNDRFFLRGDVVLPDQATPRISARLMNEQGALLVELHVNRLGRNPGGCTYHTMPAGFRIQQISGEPLLEVLTQNFPKGHLTCIKARLFDEQGQLRSDLLGESIRLIGEAMPIIEAPSDPSELHT